MKKVMVAVRDAKSEMFGAPMFMNTIGEAIRSFDDGVNRADENSLLHTHPEDFALFQLGSYEDTNGTFEIIVPKMLVQGNEVKKSINKISKV